MVKLKNEHLTKRKRLSIRSDLFEDDESVWFSRKAIASASLIEEDLYVIDFWFS